MFLDTGAVADVCAAVAYGMHERLEEILSADYKQANDLTTGESPLGGRIMSGSRSRRGFCFGTVRLWVGHHTMPVLGGLSPMVAVVKIARALLEHKANPNWRDRDGNIAQHRVFRSRIVLDPVDLSRCCSMLERLQALANAEGRTPLDEALAQSGKIGETYYPVRAISPKKLERTIELLRSAIGP